ncbi:hypothetical protein [Kinneretia aquatilis]|nr:hypothetical protein [Paucibacter aquatile]WIV97744.1 hypothetical protein K9V56_022480 [Paucibacter aquatile]
MHEEQQQPRAFLATSPAISAATPAATPSAELQAERYRQALALHGA